MTAMSTHRPLASAARVRCWTPRSGADVVRRPRLFEVIDRGIARPLTLITGPPGAGKTMLLSSWLQRADRPVAHVAWLCFEPAEASPAQFWGAVVDAADGAGEPALRSLLPRLGLDRGFLADLADVLAPLTTPLVLVLDDFHELEAPEVSEQLDALLRHPLPMLRVVIVSRADPPLSLARLRLEGQMVELRAADLAFTLAEATAMLAMAGVALTGDQLRALHARTEGWAAGLRLAALSLQATEDPGELVTTFAGDEHTVADYLVDEVLQRQPTQIRDFMLRTSVVESLSPALADALTGHSDAAQVLDRLERSNAFVSRIGDDRSMYRYHRMFRELLRSQLRHQMPDLLARQHRSAARFYARTGEFTQAARHALSAGDGVLAGDLLCTSWPALLVRGEADVAADLIARLPRELVGADPELSLAAASVQLECGQPAVASDHLARADALSSVVKPKHRAGFLAARRIAALYDARRLGDFPRALAEAEALLSAEGAARLDLDPRERRTLGLLHKGIAEMWLGHDPQARTAVEDALVLAGHAGLEYLGFGASAALAVLDAATGAFVSATDLAHDAIAVAARQGWSGRAPSAAAWCALAIAGYHRNTLGDADRALESARAALDSAGDPALRLLVALTDARVGLRHGDLKRADAAVAAARDAAQGWSLPEWLSVDLAAVHAAALLAAGRPADAEQTLTTTPSSGGWAEAQLVRARIAIATGDPGGVVHTLRSALEGDLPTASPSTAIEMRALGAVAEHGRGHDDAALELMEEALALAEPQQDLAPFLALGPAARELLTRRIRSGTAHRALAGELGELLDPRATQPEGRRIAIGVEPLSDREEVVLRYLPTTLSKAEIASEMLVSVNTVKTHMKNIYRKLDVTDRAHAVRRARTLHLV